ncbi:hypothetical protein [Desulfosediminicola flagellatus]|uniref:hypothetical protein n=1 Tax=Desulfosediminicola flagellatus TaxID=2569541 RepID=UPI0010AD588B|nr:hypothetical protein [Desulfosediminicola flagellatus]
MVTEKQTEENINDLTIDDLICKQSVRATFKLPVDLIELLGVMSGQLGIKQKSVIDQLTQDRLELKRLAKIAKSEETRRGAVKQKTFVLSRSTLNAINAIARQHNIPRDVIVEISIKRLVPLIETELEKHHKRKVIRKEMREYLMAGERLKKKTRELLGAEDDLFEMIEKQIALTEKSIDEIDTIIDKGMAMEGW